MMRPQLQLPRSKRARALQAALLPPSLPLPLPLLLPLTLPLLVPLPLPLPLPPFPASGVTLCPANTW